jgi:sec-independent protein translocase protein TatC
MSFWEHLEELRRRIIYIVITIGAIAAFCFMCGFREGALWDYKIIYPFPDIRNNIASLVFRRLCADLLPAKVELIMVKPTDAAMANIQISLFIGIVFGMPMVVYQIGKFVSPGLYAHEKRTLLKFIVPTTALFIFGCIFAYIILMPFFIEFLYGYGEAMGAHQYLSISEFISFILLLMLAFGLVFELPVFMVCLTRLGVVEPTFWKEHWRLAVVIMIFFGGVITPDTTGITQLLVAFPMMFFYLVGYLCAKRVHRYQGGV